MIPTTYTAQVLADLCRPESIEEFFEERYEIKADGLWVRDAQPGALVANRDIAEWHPRGDRGLPALPFPFTSRELAAFMLAGYGGELLEKFQREPRGIRHKDALAELGPNADKARAVWTDAYRLLIQAVRNFGRDDDGVRRSAEWLLRLRTIEHDPASVLPRGRDKSRQAQQEAAILQKLAELNFHPLALPKSKGKAGAKAKIRQALAYSVATFDKAWFRLRAGGHIRDV